MIAENIDRRHLDTGQRAIVAQDMRSYVDEQAKKRQEEGGLRGAETGNAMRGEDGKYRLMPKTASGGMALPDGPKSFVTMERGDRRSARSELAKMFNTNNEYIDKARDLTSRGARCTPRYGVSGSGSV